MKPLLSLSMIVSFLVLVPVSELAQSSSHVRNSGAGIQDKFIGAWHLVWLEEQGADGAVHRADCTGLLVYTRDGHMSVQVMYRNPQPESGAGSVQYAQGGYEASFGRYEIEESSETFTYHVDGALVRSLIGKELKRVYELSGNQLIVKSSNPNERWRVAWEHY